MSESPSLLPASPANRPVEPGSKEARMMCVGSGRKLFALLQSSGPIGLFSRTLLESETWGSTEYFLKWQGSATKSGYSIYRLVPWTARSSGTDCGSWATPTACVANLGEKPETFLARAAELKEKHGNGNGVGMPLSIQSQLTTWPTPQSRDEKGQTQNPERMDAGDVYLGKTPSGCLARTESFVERLMNLSLWLMGYTAAYLAHWETASSRKSRRKSSERSPT